MKQKAKLMRSLLLTTLINRRHHRRKIVKHQQRQPLQLPRTALRAHKSQNLLKTHETARHQKSSRRGQSALARPIPSRANQGQSGHDRVNVADQDRMIVVVGATDHVIDHEIDREIATEAAGQGQMIVTIVLGGT